LLLCKNAARSQTESRRLEALVSKTYCIRRTATSIEL